MAPTKLQRDLCGNTKLYKICCAHYRHFYIYDHHWIILSYTTLFISWMFLWVITSISPLQFCVISLTRFNEFSKFWTYYFADMPVKGTNNFWKICGLIDGFNKSRRQIASGVEKWQMSWWVPYNFVPPLKDIYRTTPLFSGSRSHWG